MDISMFVNRIFINNTLPGQNNSIQFSTMREDILYGSFRVSMGTFEPFKFYLNNTDISFSGNYTGPEYKEYRIDWVEDKVIFFLDRGYLASYKAGINTPGQVVIEGNVDIEYIDMYFNSTQAELDINTSSNRPNNNGDNWAAFTSYQIGDRVIYNGERYTCIVEHTSGFDFELNNWSLDEETITTEPEYSQNTGSTPWYVKYMSVLVTAGTLAFVTAAGATGYVAFKRRNPPSSSPSDADYTPESTPSPLDPPISDPVQIPASRHQRRGAIINLEDLYNDTQTSHPISSRRP
jgi:hypothetical protein